MLRISIDCDPSLKAPKKKYVKEIIIKILKENEISDCDISIIFGKDQLLSELKNKFFNKNQLTDVIAFRLNDYNLLKVEGELYISLPRAEENSKTYREPFTKEVSRLIIHGCLHLLGFDDDTKMNRNRMTALENKYLTNFDFHKIFEE